MWGSEEYEELKVWTKVLGGTYEFSWSMLDLDNASVGLCHADKLGWIIPACQVFLCWRTVEIHVITIAVAGLSRRQRVGFVGAIYAILGQLLNHSLYSYFSGPFVMSYGLW